MASNIFKELEKGSYTGLKRSLSLFPVSVNLKNSAGLTPLHIASHQGQAAFVKELLVHGAQHDTPDTRGNIPLHLAAEQGSVEAVVELLAGRKASVKAKNKDGQTPLHVAVLCGHKAVVAKLLETGVHAEGLKDKAGNTPLSLVDPDDAEMQQIFVDIRPLGPTASINQGVSALLGARGPDATPGGHRAASTSAGGTPISSHSGRITASQLQSFSSGGAPAGTPATPPPRGAAAGSSGGGGRTPPIGGGRTPPPAPAHTQSGAVTSRLPRSATASPGQSGGGAAPEQLQKHEVAIQSLKEGLRAATERLGALDACTAAQLECAGQVEKALAACGNHGRSILDLEARVAFQEDRGRDTRSRLERLEDGERGRQDSVKRLTDEQRGLQSQLQRLADQVTASGQAQRHASSADAASHLQGQAQLQAELAVLRAQMDQLAPALALATSASAEVRTLAARVDVMQQQMQMQQPAQAQALVGGNLVVEQQLLQMQAQIQLLQLPVANLTQQCADMSGRMAGFTDWQQQARADLAKLAEAATAAAAQLEDEGMARSHISERVNETLGVAMRSLEEVNGRLDMLCQDYQERQREKQQQAAVPASPSPPPGPPAVPGTPQSASQRTSGAGDAGLGLGLFGGPPSRNLTGPPSLGGMARDSVAQTELRSELESLKSLVSDIRKEVVTEGGSLRREWQRAFSDMQSRYGEQNNELRAREANIAKLREAALVEEAERRAASGVEDKFAARLGKLETSVEYLTHRLEVLEEQVSSVVTTLAGSTSPVLPQSPSRIAAAWAALRGGQPSARSGPGPVSENHIGFVDAASDLAAATVAVAAASAAPASARIRASPKTGRCWSTGGPALAGAPGEVTVESDGGCLRRRNPLFGVKDSTPAGSVGGEGVASAREACLARDASEYELGPDEWWRAAEAEPPEVLEAAAVPAASAAAGQPPSAQGTGGVAGLSLPLQPDIAEAEAKATAEAVAARQGAASAPQLPVMCAASGVDDAGAVDTAAQRPPAEAAAAAAAVVDRSPARAGQSGPAGFTQRPHEATLPGPEVIPPPVAREALLSARGRALPPMHAAQRDVGAGLLDPASVALGPQLLTPMANALLAPSVDIQRLAAAAAAAQQQQQLLLQHQQQYLHPVQQQPFLTGQQQMQQQQQPALQLWGGQQQQPLAGQAGSLPLGVGFPSASCTGGAPVPGRPAAASADGQGERQASGSGGGGRPARKEPPLCLFCPMQ
ncbi:hypothetical protein PLESTB_000037800 [Pleodorina starrii]|uniref:Uncharacterized protein n=1 Tax=Pleodorina starrii TaxID=330485 RepID=A0A9W6B9Y0_9CHLO|nr:hypothetical protein PLESTB_000037800 [Pleodorina starrii]